MKEQEPVILSSQQGVHQGDPLGPVLFSVTIHPILNDLQLRNRDVVVLAYLDDIFILGPSDDTLSAFNDLKSSLTPIGLTVCDRKCEIYAPSKNLPSNCQIPEATEGFSVLGTPAGTSLFISSLCQSVVQSGEELCTKLSEGQDPQCSFVLLRHCHVTKINHLARTVRHDLLLPAAHLHDQLTRKTFCRILGFSTLTDYLWKQATLDIKLGGFVLKPGKEIVHAAFVAGWAHSLSVLPDRFPERWRYVDHLLNTQPLDSDIRDHLESSFTVLPPLSDDESIFCSLQSILVQPSKLHTTSLWHKNG